MRSRAPPPSSFSPFSLPKFKIFIQGNFHIHLTEAFSKGNQTEGRCNEFPSDCQRTRYHTASHLNCRNLIALGFFHPSSHYFQESSFLILLNPILMHPGRVRDDLPPRVPPSNSETNPPSSVPFPSIPTDLRVVNTRRRAERHEGERRAIPCALETPSFPFAAHCANALPSQTSRLFSLYFQWSYLLIRRPGVKWAMRCYSTMA